MPKTVSKPDESGKSVDSKNQYSSDFPISYFWEIPTLSILPSIHPSSIHASSIHPSTIHPNIHHPSIIHPPSTIHPTIHHLSIIHPPSIHPPSILHPSSFGRPLGSLWSSLVVFGVPLAPFGVPLGRLGHPWGPFGSPVGSLWAVFWILLKIGRHFPRKNAKPLRLRTESSLPEFSRGSPAPRLPGSGVRNRCWDPTSTRAGGQDDVS